MSDYLPSHLLDYHVQRTFCVKYVSGQGVYLALDVILRASVKSKMLANSCFFYLLHLLFYVIALASKALSNANPRDRLLNYYQRQTPLYSCL
ncbi:hypothetical protein DB42_AK00210 [Neochlamydia sp. EPS4]|nr:hypothetical protein DB42_AK00210 [Neochlamydia sp. EPS4]